MKNGMRPEKSNAESTTRKFATKNFIATAIIEIGFNQAKEIQ
jgi:hypothetical protein